MNKIKSIFYYCNTCYNTFCGEMLCKSKNDYYCCPNCMCEGNRLKEIDERMITAVFALNNQDYPVKVVCFNRCKVSINFFSKNSVETLPTGFSVCRNHYHADRHLFETEIYYSLEYDSVSGFSEEKLTDIADSIELWISHDI